MINPETKAREMIIEVYQPLGYLRPMVSSDEMWNYAKDVVRKQLSLMLHEIPMYQGNINPKWKYWEEVRKSLELIP